MAEEFDDITNILNELDKSLAEGNVPEGLITEILYFRLPDLKLSDEQKSSLNEKLKAALKKTELSEDLSDSLKTDFPDLYAVLETAEEINEVADNAPADDKSDKPDENERAPQATDKRTQCLETIKRTILEPEQAPAGSATTLYNYMLDKQIDMKNASKEQKQIVAEAIKKVVDKQSDSPKLRLAYSYMMETKIKNNQELKTAIDRDFPALAATAETEKPAQVAQPTTQQEENNEQNLERRRDEELLRELASTSFIDYIRRRLEETPEYFKENGYSDEQIKELHTILDIVQYVPIDDKKALERELESRFKPLSKTQKDSVLYLESVGNSIFAEKNRAIWSDITPADKDKPSEWIGEEHNLETFTPEKYIEDNLRNSRILVNFITGHDGNLQTLTDINKRIAESDSTESLHDQFKRELEKTELRPAQIEAILACVDRAERIENYKKSQAELNNTKEQNDENEVAELNDSLNQVAQTITPEGSEAEISDQAPTPEAAPTPTDEPLEQEDIAQALTQELNDVYEKQQKEENERAKQSLEAKKEEYQEQRAAAEEEKKTYLGAELSRAWHAKSALDYVKQTFTESGLEQELKQKIFNLITTTFPNPDAADRVYQQLKTALDANTEFNDEQKNVLLRVAEIADSIAAEKATSRWAHISRVANPSTEEEKNSVALFQITPEKIKTFSARNYIKDNIENNEILKAFAYPINPQIQEELLKINEKITDSKDIHLQFETLMAQSSVQFTPEIKAAVLDFVGRAETISTLRTVLEQQQQAVEKRAKCIELIKNRIINAKELSSHSIIMLNNYMVDKEINMKDASKEDKKVVAEALKKVIAKYPNSDVLISAYSSMMGTPKVSSVQELLDTINKDFPSDSSTAENTGNTTELNDKTEEERLLNSQTPAEYVISRLKEDEELKTALGADFTQLSAMVSIAQKVDETRKQDTPQASFSDDYITQLKESNIFTPEQIDLLTQVAEIANTVDERIAEEQHRAEEARRQEEERQRQEEEAQRQAEDTEKQRDEENRFLYSRSAADYIMRCLTDNQDLKDALNLTDSQRDTVINTAFDVGVDRRFTITSTDFSEDFIEKLKEEDKSLTDEQLDILTDLAKRANEVEKRVLEEEAEAEAKNNEYRDLSSKLSDSMKIDDYIASIEPLLGAEALKNAMALKTRYGDYAPCAIALTNPDWLIALQETYKNDWMSLTDELLPEDRKNTWQKIGIKAEELMQGGKTERSLLSEDGRIEKARVKEDIDGIILARLNMLTASDITPENAFAWLHLASGISDFDLIEKINKMVGEALHKYDQEHFGNQSEEVLTANYEDFSKRIQDVIDDDKNAQEIMSEYYVTDDKDGPLSTRKEKQFKKNLLELAAELVAEDYAKYPPFGSDEEKAIAIKQAIKDKLETMTDGQKRLTQNDAIGILGANMVKAETFKDRIKAKFAENCPLYKKVNDRLTSWDKKMTQRYGKKYIWAKKISKVAAKTGRGIGLFAVASAVAPGVGPAALIAYYSYKQAKSAKEQFNASQTMAEKAAVAVSGAISLGFLAFGAQNIAQGLGATTPELTRQAGNFLNTVAGKTMRVAAMTFSVTLPNLATGFSINRKIKAKQKELIDQRKSLPPVTETDLKTIQKAINEDKKSYRDLLAEITGDPDKASATYISKDNIEAYLRLQIAQQEYQALMTQKQMNNEAAIEKGLGALIGGTIGTTLSPWVQAKIGSIFGLSAAAAEVQAATKEAPQSEITEPQETKLMTDSIKSEQTDSIKVAQSSATQEQTDSVATSNELAEKVAAAQRAEAGDTTQTSAPTQASNETETKSETESKAEAKAETKAEEKSETESKAETKAETKAEEKSETKAEAKAETESKQPDAKVTEQHAKNFEAAKVAGTSGHGNMSAYDDTLRHLNNWGDSRFTDPETTAQQLTEHLGEKANIATVACRMAPNLVSQALGLGDDGKSYAMADYLANNDLTPEQQTNLNNLLQEKFGDWYSNAETHGVAPTSHTGDNNDNNTNQGNTGAKEAAEGNKTNATAAATAKATATTAAAVAADQAAAAGGKTAPDATGETQWQKMDVAPTGNKTADTLNAKYAVTNGLAGEQKESISFKPLTAEEAALLGLGHHAPDQSAQQQEIQQQTNQHHATVEHRQTQHQQQETYDRTTEHVVYGAEVYGSEAWAIQHGYTMFDAELTMKLNHGGMLNDDGSIKHHGYAAAYRNPFSGRVFLVPNEPLEDRDLAQSYSAEMIKIYKNGNDGVGSGPFRPSNNPFGIVNTIAYGTGHIHHASSPFTKVMAGIATGVAVLNSVSHTLGHHHHHHG